MSTLKALVAGDKRVHFQFFRKGELMNKKGAGKYRGGISPSESLITLENGFDKVHELDKGTSPFHAIDVIDSKYADA